MAYLDLFLKIDGIEGECQDPKHKGELQVLSFSKTVTSLLDSAGAERGLSQWTDAVFTMRMDKAYPKLFLAVVNADPFLGPRSSVLTFRKAGKQQQEFLKITFSDVLMSRCQLSAPPDVSRNDSPSKGRDPNRIPFVTFAFNFASITEEYRTQKDDGSLSGPITYSFAIKRS